MLLSISHTMNPAIKPRLPYDAIRSFSAAATRGSGPLVVAAHLAESQTAQKLAAESAEPWMLSSAWFSYVVSSEVEKWTRVVREANIRPE